MATPPRSRPERAGGELLRAALLAALAAGAYALFPAQHVGADGTGLLELHVAGGTSGAGRGYHHVLFLPVARLFAALAPGLSPLRELHLLSALAGGALVGATYLLARVLGAERRSCAVAALLAGCAPGAVANATWIEVHALHAAVVACGAAAVLAARGGGVALALAAAGYALAYGTHQSGIVLGLGFTALVAWAAERRGERVALPRLAGAAAVLLAAGVGAMALGTLWRTGALDTGIGDAAEFTGRWQAVGSMGAALWEEWALPLGIALPLGLAGLATGVGRRALVCCAGLAGVPLAFFAWYGIVERGGFLLPGLPLYAALAARALDRVPRRAFPAAAALVLAAQGALGARDWMQWNAHHALDERLAQVDRALPEGGTLLSLPFPENSCPRADLFRPPVREVALQGLVWEQVLAGRSPEDVASAVADRAGEALREGPTAVDLAFVDAILSRPASDGVAYVRALADALPARFETERLEHPDWPMLVLVGERGD